MTDADTEAGRGEGLAWMPLPDTVDLKACPECGETALEGQEECFGCGGGPYNDRAWREFPRLRHSFGFGPRVTKDDVREESERYATDYVEKVYERLLTAAPTDEAPEGEQESLVAALEQYDDPDTRMTALEAVRVVTDEKTWDARRNLRAKDTLRRLLDRTPTPEADPYDGEEACPNINCGRGWGHEGPCDASPPVEEGDGPRSWSDAELAEFLDGHAYEEHGDCPWHEEAFKSAADRLRSAPQGEDGDVD